MDANCKQDQKRETRTFATVPPPPGFNGFMPNLECGDLRRERSWSTRSGDTTSWMTRELDAALNVYGSVQHVKKNFSEPLEPRLTQPGRNLCLQTLPMTCDSGRNTWAGHTADDVDLCNPRSFCLATGSVRSPPVLPHAPAPVGDTRYHILAKCQLLSRISPWMTPMPSVLFAHSLADTIAWCSAIECAKSHLKSNGRSTTSRWKYATSGIQCPGDARKLLSITWWRRKIAHIRSSLWCTEVTSASPGYLNCFHMNPSTELRLRYGHTCTTTIACVSLSWRGKKVAKAARCPSWRKSPLLSAITHQLRSVALSLRSSAVQNNHWSDQLRKTSAMFTGHRTRGEDIQSPILEEPAPVLDRCRPPIRVPVNLHYYFALWVEFPMSPVARPSAEQDGQRCDGTSNTGDDPHCARAWTIHPWLFMWKQHQPMEEPPAC